MHAGGKVLTSVNDELLDQIRSSNGLKNRRRFQAPSLRDEKAKIKALEDERTCEQLGSANRKINELSSITNDSFARDEIRPPAGVCKPVQDRFLSVFNSVSVADNERNKFKGAIHHRLAWLPVIIEIDPATDIPKPLPYPDAGTAVGQQRNIPAPTYEYRSQQLPGNNSGNSEKCFICIFFCRNYNCGIES
jgi:hypothetical protein